MTMLWRRISFPSSKQNVFTATNRPLSPKHTRPAAFRKVNGMNNRYIDFYNHKRIQLKTGVAPLTLHHSA